MNIENPKKNFKRNLGKTLVLWFIIFSIIPITVVGTFSYYNAYNIHYENAEKSLKSASKLKTECINSYFSRMLTNLRQQSESQPIVKFQLKLEKGFKASNKSLSDFVSSYEWTMIAEDERNDLKNYQRTYAYENIFLIDYNGNILFTALDDKSLGTNLFKDKYSNTLFAATCKKSLETGELFFSDYEHYAPSNNLISGFISSVIVDKNRDTIGLLAFQFSINQIDKIMQSEIGLGKTAESYLVGPDLRMRSNSVLKEHKTALRDIIETDQTRLWQEKHVGNIEWDSMEEKTFVYNGPLGKRVLGIHSQIEIAGVPFAIIAEIEEAEAFASVTKLRNIIFGLVAATSIMIVFLAIVIYWRIIKPIRKLSSGIKLIAGGHLNQEIAIEAKNEIGELADSFNNLLRGLHRTTEKNEAQNWLKTGQMELSTRMSGEQDIGILGASVINYIAEYLNAQVGTIYMVDEENHLKLIGTHAYTRRKGLANELIFGEGLVGQAALEKKPIILTNCPEDYICISSGIGETVPNNIIVFPLQADNVVKGVIELGTIHDFSVNDLAFLKQVSEFIAISIGSIASRMKVNTLLTRTQEQAESLQAQQEELTTTNEELEKHMNALQKSKKKLQTQQEELMASNEELEEHMNALQKSEENMQAQQEELMASNEVLEVKTITLKEQRNALDEKNRDVEKARKELEQKAKELVLANKYKSEFLASMSHELRTPLNSLLILSKLLQNNKSHNLTKKQVEFAKTIHQSGNDLLTLINDILDLSKVEAGKMEVNWEKIHLTSYIGNIEKTFRHVANEKKLGFSTRVSDEVPEIIHSDPVRVAQILKNLLSNAFKFTKKGNVSLEVAKPFNGVPFFDKNLTTEKTIAFKVTDTGIGLPAEKQKIIFEAFKQADSSTSRKYGGTGLGLSISLEIAKLLGGEIHLESEEGIGSTFTLVLPMRPHEREVIARESREEEVIDSNVTPDTKVVSTTQVKTIKREIESIHDDRRELTPGEKSVLMVDDDPGFLRILSELAHEKGFKTLVAGDGHTGLHMADYYHPSAIILDINMPELNGFDVMKRLKENPNTHHIPVHFISAYDRTAEALEMGAIGLLTKPVSTEDIEQCFEKFESLIDAPIKRVLIVENDKAQQMLLTALFKEKDVTSTVIGSGEEAVELLKKSKFDCIIVDLDLTGEMTGLELVDKINNDDSVSRPPIIIYTGKKFSNEEEIALKQRSDSIIIKGDSSPQRLKDEVALFLHKVEDELPEQHRKALKAVYSRDETLEGKKVLLVDDDMRNVFALSSVLQDQGLTVIVGKNGKEGIAQLKANTDISIVLMDIMMPEMNGYEAMSTIRKKDDFENIPIIALTAKAMKGEKDRCLEAGASDYLSKPVDTERLLSLMRVWMHKE
jgi:CheY-like chemotaxis protein/HAMP domain-containing protein